MKKKWPLWKKFILFLLIALYFGGVFSFAYGYRLKQTDTAAYEALMAKVDAKMLVVKQKVYDTGAVIWDKSSEFASATKNSIFETGSAVKENISESWKKTFESGKDVYAQEPETITSPVDELSGASHETDETRSYLDTITGETILTGGPYDILYYNQTDPRWKDKFYGNQDTIGKYGCGPTSLATVVSSLTKQKITPEEMALWAKEHGYFCNGSGSYHTLIPEGAMQFGLKVENLGIPSEQAIIEALWTGKIVVVLMSQGHFTSSGHFMLLRGVTLDGKILIADPLSLDNSLKSWDLDILMNELKQGAAAGGPVWAITK